jgi:hypothetical protein
MFFFTAYIHAKRAVYAALFAHLLILTNVLFVILGCEVSTIEISPPTQNPTCQHEIPHEILSED